MIKSCTLYLFILFPVFIFAQKENFVNKKDSLLPGTSTSISFTIENRTSENKIYDIKVETTSPHISPILTNGELRISASESNVYIVPLKVATETPQGKYSVILNGTERKTGETFTQKTEFRLAGIRKLTLTALHTPEFVKAGETIISTFLLKNSGNVSENLILESKNAVVNEGTSLLLPPGESKIITVSKTTSSVLGKNEYQNLNLSVSSKNNPAETQNGIYHCKNDLCKTCRGRYFSQVTGLSLTFIHRNEKPWSI